MTAADEATGTTTGPSHVRVTKRRARTRTRLLDAAATVFAEHGFGQVSIEQICDAAGFSRGAFYSNFATTDELFFGLYADRSTAVVDQVAAALASVTGDGERGSAADLVERVVAALVLDRQWTLIRTEFLLYAARRPQVAAALAEHREALRTTLAPHLAGSVDQTRLPAALRSEQALADAVITVYDGAVLRVLIDSDERSARRWLTVVLLELLA